MFKEGFKFQDRENKKYFEKDNKYKYLLIYSHSKIIENDYDVYGIDFILNNIEKFPERYCFQLNDEESNNLRSKISTSKINSHGGRRYNQRVFTEQGVYMLATILKSKIAASITIAIMDAFVVMKNIINNKHDCIEDHYLLYYETYNKCCCCPAFVK